MRHVIIGAGAVGGTIGGRLFEGGHEVVLVARGPHLDALRAHGLRLATPDGVVALPVAAVGQPGELELRDGDVLVLAVKTQDAEAVLAEWAWRPVRGGTVAAGSLPVVCAQNGVASERMALRRFRHVYGVCVWLPATHLEPGTVEAQGAPLTGMLNIGRYPSGTDAMATRIGAELAQSRFLAPVSADVMRWKYGKLISNLGNALNAMASRLDDEPVADLLRRVRAEGERVLVAAGVDYATPAEQRERRGDRMTSVPLEGVELGGSSSRQSLARRTGSIEADYLNGEIVLLARRHGVSAPLNEALRGLANTFAREGRPPGSLSDPELTALLELPAR